MASIVMSAAANNLTPVTLELGGKSPAILDSLPNSSEFRVWHALILKFYLVEVLNLMKTLLLQTRGH